MLAAIPYTTFPDIELGPLTLRTFGLMVALGVLLGAWIAASYAERFGISRDETYRVGTWMVLAGIIGSRLTWAATHTDQIENPIDVIAIWEGGIQFSGGFIFAVIVGLPFFRRWDRLMRWRVLDGYALGLALGLGLGRVGCYAVGEHFGRTSDFFLASRYDGGEVREPMLGDIPLIEGTTFHNTSLYEFLYMMVLFVLLGALAMVARRRGRELAPGTLIGVFVLYYGVARFLSDSLRVNDERVLHMTGAQWMCLVLVPAGLWILLKVRPALATLAAADASSAGAESDAGSVAAGEPDAGDDGDGEAGDDAGADDAEAGGAGAAAAEAAAAETEDGESAAGDDADSGNEAGGSRAGAAETEEGESAAGGDAGAGPAGSGTAGAGGEAEGAADDAQAGGAGPAAAEAEDGESAAGDDAGAGPAGSGTAGAGGEGADDAAAGDGEPASGVDTDVAAAGSSTADDAAAEADPAPAGATSDEQTTVPRTEG